LQLCGKEGSHSITLEVIVPVLSIPKLQAPNLRVLVSGVGFSAGGGSGEEKEKLKPEH
jgi:hypothetical protein